MRRGTTMMAAAKHGLIVYLGTAVSSLMMLAAKVYINRALGTEALGQYELGLSLILLISVFAMFGFPTSIARIVAKRGSAAYPLVRRAFLWVVCVCAAATAISNPLVNWAYRGKVEPNFVLYLSLFLFGVCLLNLNMAFYQGKQRMTQVSLITALDSLARGAAVGVSVVFAFTARSLLLTMGLFSLAFELVVTSRFYPALADGARGGGEFRELAHLSFYIFLIAASGAISTRVSAFVIAYRLDSLNLGWFAMATLFTLPLSLLGKTIETVLLPRASAAEDFPLRRFGAMALAVAVGAVLFYAVASGTLMLAFGRGNVEAVRALKILSVGYSAVVVYSVFSAYIFGRGSQSFLGKLVGLTFIGSAAIAPSLNAYLVNEMGLMGAAWATNISLLIQTCLWVIAGLLFERRAGSERV